ncbi:MAG: transcription-repair coupling factor [Clostridiales Family XIII bacterium]|jgi:transcription-repair coupling factor (superfamily II helicase)|nr:transcription-repair coupling factor [Clostridiales Family XIII bacterium]
MVDRRITHISGLSESRIAPFVADVLRESDENCLIVAPYFERAKAIAKDLSFFLSRDILVAPEDDPFFSGFEAKSHGSLHARINALIALREGTRKVVVAPVSAVLKKLLPVSTFFDLAFTVAAGAEIDLDEIRRMLPLMGFERATFTENRGEYSLRGGILDIRPADAERPIRAEFFGDEIESVRFFDAENQKTVERIDRYTIFPAVEFLPDANMRETAATRIERAYGEAIARAEADLRPELERGRDRLSDLVRTLSNRQLLENYTGYFTDDPANLTDCLPETGILVIDDPDRVREAAALREKEAVEDFKTLLSLGRAVPEDFNGFAGTEDISALYETGHELLAFTPYDRAPEDLKRAETFEGTVLRGVERIAKEPPAIGGNTDVFIRELRRYIKRGFAISIVCSTEERMFGLRELLLSEGLENGVRLVRGDLTAGLELTDEKTVWLRDGDIFRSDKRRKRRAKFSEKRKPIKAFTDIEEGDFVVHELHGIGRYIGMEQISVQGDTRDYLKIAYEGNDTLYVPADRISLVWKYIGGGESRPKLNKLSGSEWKNAKARARADIAEMAKELAVLSAERKTAVGHAFSKDTVWQKDFEDKFPYEETEDQLRSVAAIKKDMERPIPMDRLLCGDVGYGKTEVALRAVFKCVADGMQAAVLVPTTILASQHYGTFKERFADFPFTVEVMSRFRTAAEQTAVLKGIAKGTVDAVIGTHRLLSKDVAFKDLGLLVVDEEQRFGVRHKERIKAMKKNVDVLTLTATPIPRTLHMSLLGIRDMDIIEEPPEDRYPIQTYVMEQSDEIIRETLRRELGRNGQVYAVVSRIDSIGRVADEIRRLVPEASVAAGHGRMKETELEDVMMDFIEGKFDVLVSTTIIESGIDIPNVNTILIFDADRFGLSQLYQLRGRVGRADKHAFAYLLYRKDKIVSEIAEKRLRTIKEFTELGAGFKIAMRDLEIRGAGNLLGSEQHGHMVTVGYELYCKMVEDAVRALSGTPAREADIDAQIDLPFPAFIPNDYIEDEILRLQIYKKISMIETLEDAEDILAELSDRFGPPPEAAERLVFVSLMRQFAVAAGIETVKAEKGCVVLRYASEGGFHREGASAAFAKFGDRLVVGGVSPPFLRLSGEKGSFPDTQEILELLDMVMV